MSTAQEKLWWLFLLHTGCREGEMTHATWDDLDLGTREFHVTFKEGFTPKDREERTVPFGQELCDALKACKEASCNLSDDALIFPHNGKVHRHIIRNLKQCAKLADLRGDWYLHRFRHTFAMMHLRAGVDVATVSEWLGHSDLATTSIYLRKLENEKKETQAAVDRTFAGIKSGLGAIAPTVQ